MTPAASRPVSRGPVLRGPVLRVGGVPEHFNLPWHHAIDQGHFAEVGVDVSWTDQPGGTGEMMQNLADGELDVAVALTEGIVKAINGGLAARIVRYYTTSPLQWGVHVRAAGPLGNEAAITADSRFAISRFGSGSHLMAHVLADRLGFAVADDRFVVVGNLDGARAALAADDPSQPQAEVFLWDRFMTSPFVEAGEFDRVGIQPSPWPSFAIVVSDDCLERNRTELVAMLDVVADAAQRFAARTTADAAAEVAQRYDIAPAQAADWFEATEFAPGEPVDTESIGRVQDQLRRLGVIDDVLPVDRYLAPL